MHTQQPAIDRLPPVLVRDWTGDDFDEASFWLSFYARTFEPCLGARRQWPSPGVAYMVIVLRTCVEMYRTRIGKITKAILEDQ